jgi:branched-chain amino acid transport system ATP-binding protein
MSPLLEVSRLNVHYGTAHALQDVDLTVDPGEVVAVLGRNGVGKTTLLHAIMGLLRPSSGSVRFEGRELCGRDPTRVARAGLALVPQGRRVFAPLSVEENLAIAVRGRGEWTLERVLDLLPVLRERRGSRGDQLSGGEQQMLAIGRALLGNPRLIMLDEPLEGLAPLVVERVADVLRELRARRVPALLVEQNLRVALELADRVVVMNRGRIAHRAAAADFRRQRELAHELLGVA